MTVKRYSFMQAVHYLQPLLDPPARTHRQPIVAQNATDTQPPMSKSTRKAQDNMRRAIYAHSAPLQPHYPRRYGSNSVGRASAQPVHAGLGATASESSDQIVLPSGQRLIHLGRDTRLCVHPWRAPRRRRRLCPRNGGDSPSTALRAGAPPCKFSPRQPRPSSSPFCATTRQGSGLAPAGQPSLYATSEGWWSERDSNS